VNVTVRPADKSEAGILKNLLELYLHDFSEFSEVDIDEDGHFGYPFLDNYWQDPDRFPFLILVDNRLAGFALVRQETDPRSGDRITDMAEFFVLRHFRRRQVGSQAAVKLWDRFSGPWEVRVLASNRGAYPFWKDLIRRYSNEQFAEDNGRSVLGDMQKFTFSAGN
jgi:predicted acetyltransferase